MTQKQQELIAIFYNMTPLPFMADETNTNAKLYVDNTKRNVLKLFQLHIVALLMPLVMKCTILPNMLVLLW